MLDALDWPVRTGRLILRRPTREDFDALWEFRKLNTVGEWLGWHPSDREDYEATIKTKGSDTVAVLLKGQVIGELMIKLQDAWGQREVAERAKGSQAELGWVFDPGFGGQGYATEAVSAAIDLCFGPLGLRRIEAGAFAANEPSWRLMERVGMRREGYFVKESLHREHGWMDGISYALLREEWAARRA